MPVFRINKTKNYTVMSNYHLKDKKLSFKAKGLLSYMLSLPDDWDYSVEGLCKAGKDNKSAIRSALEELKDNKYLIINKLMPNESKSGRIESEYIIFEVPNEEKQKPKINSCFSEVENQPQINTKKQNTKIKKNIKKKNTNFNQRIYTDKELNQLYNNISFNEW